MGSPLEDLDDGASKQTASVAAAREHWAFQPVLPSELPGISNPSHHSRVASPIDLFVVAKLEAHDLSLSPPPDRRTLLRRVYYDLIGLPPNAEDVERFELDASPDAYARVVDRLLASPRYGERWGRHWLDVARYSDTKDVVLIRGKDAIRPFAYTYRDYVIRAFNEDVPYDRFVEDQLAADQIVSDSDHQRWRLGAMGFLTLGRVFNNLNPHDIYDDQIDAVTRGFLALTAACARCHDHKYDPIPTADYYSLHGVFASSVTPDRYPLVAEPRVTPEYQEFVKREAKILSERNRLVDGQYELVSEETRVRTADYLEEIVTKKADPLATAIFFMSLSPGDLVPRILNRWRRYLSDRSHADDPIFGPWHDLMRIPESELPARSRQVVTRWSAVERGTSSGELNPLVAHALARALHNARLTTRADVARIYGELFSRVYFESKSGDPRQQSDAFRKVLEVVAGQQSPLYFTKRDTYQYMTRVPIDRYRKSFNELDALLQKSPAAPPRAMTLVDSRELYDPHVFVRGDPSRPGRAVPRQFLGILAGTTRRPFSSGSGRLDLAHAITARYNPLTSRVIVNRIWMHHFGEPLVRTPSDFGLRSDPPSHPGLLDELASTLVDDGWSIKALQRRIVLSSTYRQSSRNRDDCVAVDPENRLLWRAHRRRLGLEAMRDSFLFASGRLDPTMYGPSVDIAGDPSSRRRTVYGIVDRQDLPTLFRAFDFPSADQTAARRPQTTVAQQALFALNAPFMIAQVRALASRPEVVRARAGAERVRELYRLVLLRDPSAEETSAALGLVDDAARDGETDDPGLLGPWEQLAHVLLLTNELLFVD